MINKPLVSIITINYNGSEDTREFLNSLKSITYPVTEVFVVENGSTKNKFLPYLADYPYVKYIVSEKNLGFAGGNNLAINQASGKYILLINNDTTVTNDFLEPLVELMESDDKIGMVSPKIVFHTPGNIIQYAGSSGLNSFTRRGTKIGYLETDKGQYNKITETRLIHGSAVLFRSDITNVIGLIPEIYFLYYEEYDWCEAATRSGFKLYFCGLSTIYHKGSKSIGRKSPLKTYFLTRNRLLYIRRNTTGIEFITSFLFFVALALPKLILRNIFSYDYLKAIYSAMIWNYKSTTGI